MSQGATSLGGVGGWVGGSLAAGRRANGVYGTTMWRPVGRGGAGKWAPLDTAVERFRKPVRRGVWAPWDTAGRRAPARPSSGGQHTVAACAAVVPRTRHGGEGALSARHHGLGGGM